MASVRPYLSERWEEAVSSRSGGREPRSLILEGRRNAWMEERALERQAPCRPLKKPLAKFIIIFIANNLARRLSKQRKEKQGMRSCVSDLARQLCYISAISHGLAKSQAKLQELKRKEKKKLVNSDTHLRIKIRIKYLMSAGLLMYEALALD